MNLSASNLEKILDGFDPNTNEQDRRILYEVTGMQIDINDFKGEESTESEDDEEEVDMDKVKGRRASFFDIEYAFLHRQAMEEAEQEEARMAA